MMKLKICAYCATQPVCEIQLASSIPLSLPLSSLSDLELGGLVALPDLVQGPVPRQGGEEVPGLGGGGGGSPRRGFHARVSRLVKP